MAKRAIGSGGEETDDHDLVFTDDHRYSRRVLNGTISECSRHFYPERVLCVTLHIC